MERLGIDYDKKYDNFEVIRDVISDLIWGDMNYVPNPWITYVIPAYDRAYLLEETLRSVLNQKDVDFQWDIIVVDNEAGDENDTERLIRTIDNPKILYYRNRKNIGVDGNYNRCIELARGKWVAMLHADDLIMDDHLSLMGKYIREHEHDRKQLAYISPSYLEFSNSGKVILSREKAALHSDSYIKKMLTEQHLRKEINRYGYIDMLLTGNTVSPPTFGTVMNREIMIREGGFNDELGICEDVIIPFKLSQKYKVYKTSYIMGYYRRDNGESAQNETLLKIYQGMLDFREYVYSRNILTRMWGNIVRDELNRNLAKHCIQISRFNKEKLSRKEFEEIYKPGNQSWFARKIYALVLNIYSKIAGSETYDQYCRRQFENILDDVLSLKERNNCFILYGAGSAGKRALRYYRKHVHGINIECFAVSRDEDKEMTVSGVKVLNIENLTEYTEKANIIVTTFLQEYMDEMVKNLDKLGFKSYLTLIKEVE